MSVQLLDVSHTFSACSGLGSIASILLMFNAGCLIISSSNHPVPAPTLMTSIDVFPELMTASSSDVFLNAINILAYSSPLSSLKNVS